MVQRRPRPFRAQIVFVAVCAALAAQDPGPLRLRIDTVREGMHRVSGAQIATLHPLERVQPDRLRMTRQGKPVALYVHGAADGRLDPSDDVMFFAPPTDSPHNRTESFVLEDVGDTWFYSLGEPSRELRSAELDAAAVKVRDTWREKAVFDPLNTLRKEVLRGDARPFWWTASIGPGETVDRAFGGALVPIRGAPARVSMSLFGSCVDAVPQSLRILMNGVECSVATWDSPFERTLDVLVPGQAVKPANVLALENRTSQPNVVEPNDDLGRPKKNRLLVASATFTYETRLQSPAVTRAQIVAHVVGSGSKAPRRLSVDNRVQSGFQTFDPVAGKVWRGELLDVADADDVPLAVVTAGGAYDPVAVAKVAPRPNPGTGADYVVVTTSRFRRVVEPLVQHRRAQGLVPFVVEARALYDHYGAGRASPVAIKAFLAEGARLWKTKPKYVLLVGDADYDVDFKSELETLPTFLVRTAYNGATASDAAYGDFDGDGTADAAVGRLPARTPEDLLTMVRRTIRTETEAPAGPWRREAVFFAGEGRFGPAVDKMIEQVAGNLVAKEIPPEFAVTMTYGNPSSAWYWPAAQFDDAVVAAFNRGAALFNYIGHGSPTAFDHVAYRGKRYPILRSDDVARLDNGGRAGLVSIIACSTGHFDDPERDCIAETMMAKEGGPLAVFASSRVSHPFANALLGQGLVKAAFKADLRLGDLILDAKVRMAKESKGLMATLAKPHLSKAVTIGELVADHVHLYQLFGDPAARLPFATSPAEFVAPDAVAPGASATLKVAHKGAGDVLARLEKPRAALLGSGGGELEDDAAVRSRHAAANEVVVASATGKLVDGVWTGTVAAPADLAPGDYVVTVYVTGAGGTPDAVAARPIKVGAADAGSRPDDKR